MSIKLQTNEEQLSELKKKSTKIINKLIEIDNFIKANFEVEYQLAQVLKRPELLIEIKHKGKIQKIVDEFNLPVNKASKMFVQDFEVNTVEQIKEFIPELNKLKKDLSIHVPFTIEADFLRDNVIQATPQHAKKLIRVASLYTENARQELAYEKLSEISVLWKAMLKEEIIENTPWAPGIQQYLHRNGDVNVITILQSFK